MSWMRNLRPTLDERGIRVRNIYRHPNLLYCEFRQARQDFHSVEIFIKPFRKRRLIPLSQCFSHSATAKARSAATHAKQMVGVQPSFGR